MVLRRPRHRLERAVDHDDGSYVELVQLASSSLVEQQPHVVQVAAADDRVASQRLVRGPVERHLGGGRAVRRVPAAREVGLVVALPLGALRVGIFDAPRP